MKKVILVIMHLLLVQTYPIYAQDTIDSGGAHPSHETMGYNFDYKNKIQLVDVSEVYPNINYYKLLKKKYGDDTSLQNECKYFTEGQQRWEYYSWVLTKEGITITPSSPHPMAPCDIGFMLTHKELQQND
jgi:hypothetical protein